MTSPRNLVLAGALAATLATAGCSFSGGLRAEGSASATPSAGTTPSSAPTARPSEPPAPGTDPTTPRPAATSGTSTSSAAPRGAPAPAGSRPTTAPTTAKPAAPPPAKPTGPTGLAAGDPGRCATQDLAITVGPAAGGGTAGASHADVVMVNRGSAACTLEGFPGVSAVAGPDGHQVGAASSPTDEGPVPARVTLAAGGVAHVSMRIGSYQDYPAETCRPADFDGYRVYPPGSRAAAYVPLAGTTCSAPEVSVLSVQPVQPGPPSP